ncbi:MAG: TonB-dependent receptor [Gammaproteobacteria bacterium]|nr:TonB-dependent receptor [Gammaproteobacteria bacterium]
MKHCLIPLSFLLLATQPGVSVATEPGSESPAPDDDIEIVVVTGVRLYEELLIESSPVARPGLDNSELLRLFPGGNRNANGPLTRISQYRGLFGAQNSVAIDGFAYSADCPNWMDSPLSSIPQSLTDSVTLFRGLGSVDEIEEGLGGGIRIESRNAGFSNRPDWGTFGNAELSYGENASAWGAAVYSGFRNDRHWVDIGASRDTGDDYAFDGGVVAASEYDREQYRFGYGHRFASAELRLGAVINRTGPTGTPALPMDMRFVDSEQYRLEIDAPVGPGRLSLSASTTAVDHVMDNFTLRPPPLNPRGMPKYRQSAPSGGSDAVKGSWEVLQGESRWVFGFDGVSDDHEATITDPTNDRFYIVNFNDVERERIGLFALVARPAGAWDMELGLRYNRVRMDAGAVGGDLAMMMNAPPPPMRSQQDRLDELADRFNRSQRRQSDDQWSAIFKASRRLGDEWRFNFGIGRKMRSPTYEERYIWLPLEATAGLADGRTYLGDVELQPEKSIELTAGIEWGRGRLSLTPELFYREIDDFIQGVPSTNRTANEFALMMGGKLPLQYANVDAELYGFDMGYDWEISDHWRLRGNLSYVRGKRTDQPDNLYRIAPLSSFLELLYERERYFVAVESVAAARQDKVAAFNDEKETAGWGILNLRGGFVLNEHFTVGLGVENLFDKVYRDHLGGYNRVRDSDIPPGQRLISMGRNAFIKLNANW